MGKRLKWKYGFKVVRRTRDVGEFKIRLVSCFSDRELEYRKGKITKPFPGDGPLALFADLEKAWLFVHGVGGEDVSIYHCKYVEWVPENDQDFLRGLWFRLEGPHSPIFAHSFGPDIPLGTVFARQVVLTSFITDGSADYIPAKV